MTTQIDKLKEIYLANDVDSEDYADNLARITEWESALRKNEDFVSWQESDVTKNIYQQAKETYKEAAMQLWRDRTLTDAQRATLWAKQDAALWIISMIAKDAKSEITYIQTEIRKALRV